MSSGPIVSILPPREGFGPGAFGAVSLSVKDFTEHSVYKDNMLILGAVDTEPFPKLSYETLPVNRQWYEPNSRAYVRAVKTRIANLQPKLVEVHNRPHLVAKIRRFYRGPMALHLHNDPQEMKAASNACARQLLLQQLDAVYCISDWVRTRYLEDLPQSVSNKVHTIHSGLALPSEARAKDQHIVYVGRMTPNKGGLEYAQALKQLLPNHTDWHGYAIGGRRHSESVKLSDYEQHVLSTMESIGSNAHYEGFYPYDKTQAAFANAAIVVIPSLWEEPFGRTGVEAIAHGCAVITSGRGGLKEIIGDAGIILDDITGETIAGAMESLIADPEKRLALQAAARNRAKQFSIQICTERLDVLRASLMENESRHAA